MKINILNLNNRCGYGETAYNLLIRQKWKNQNYLGGKTPKSLFPHLERQWN